MVARYVDLNMRWKFNFLMFVYNKMPEKCACGMKCDHGPPGRCKAKHALPARFTKKGKKVKFAPRAVNRPKLY
jgi:hypothetical protein